MAIYHEGQPVKEGFYLRYSPWGFQSVPRGGDILAGKGKTPYIRVPLPVLVVAGSLLGLVYVISLPIIVCLAVIYLLTSQAKQSLRAPRYHLPSDSTVNR